LIAVVSVPTVTDTAFATVDMFLGSRMPTASMICMSLMEISLKLPVISARFSISSTSLNSITSRSFRSFSFSMHHHLHTDFHLRFSISYFGCWCNDRYESGFRKIPFSFLLIQPPKPAETI
jgi:hypothetical protein